MTSHIEEKLLSILSEINESLKVISKSYVNETSKSENNKTLKEVLNEIRNELNIPPKSAEDEKLERILNEIKKHFPNIEFIIYPTTYDEVNFIPHRYLGIKKDTVYINTKIDLTCIAVPVFEELPYDDIKKVVEDIHKFLLTNEIGKI